jgi:hypothetical protein
LQTTRIEAIEKRTGRLVFDRSVPTTGGQFYAMRTDARAGRIELIRHDLAIRFQREGATSENGIKSEETPAAREIGREQPPKLPFPPPPPGVGGAPASRIIQIQVHLPPAKPIVPQQKPDR